MIGGHHGRVAGDCVFQQVLGLVGRIGIEPEDLAEVRLAEGRQHQPVDLGSRHGLFVRKDLALAERREPQSGHEAAANVRRALGGELLMIDIDGRIGFGEQHALGLPVFQIASGPGYSGCRVASSSPGSIRFSISRTTLQGCCL